MGTGLWHAMNLEALSEWQAKINVYRGRWPVRDMRMTDLSFLPHLLGSKNALDVIGDVAAGEGLFDELRPILECPLAQQGIACVAGEV